VEFRPAYHSGQSEYELFRDLFREMATRWRSYRRSNSSTGTRAAQGPFEIDLVYRRLGVQEFCSVSI